MTLWGGRFTKEMHEQFRLFNSSLKFDYKLVEEDIIASIAWSKALVTVNVLTAVEQKKIENALNVILIEINDFPNIILENNAEDIHSLIEKKLIIKLGSLGKKLHTGRSRNDQIATDLKLWCKKKIYNIIKVIQNLQKTFILIAENNQDIIIPGYTHLQQAQLITFAHWCLAYNEMFLRDKDRLKDTLERLNTCPLGSGALSGSYYHVDRENIAKSLGFIKATRNSLDSVSDRDYVLEILSNASISMVHLSRFAEDLIFFNANEINFIELSDNITSGSSLMPQKKNPDILELIRGKCGKVQGLLINLLITFKGLPLSYNKDMQEDKENLFDAIETWLICLNMAILVLKNFNLRKIRCYEVVKNSYANSTELADYLVLKGVPFREAHYIVGKIVNEAINKNISLEDMPLIKFKKFSSIIEKDVYNLLKPISCLSNRDVKGGTSPKILYDAILEAKSLLD